MEKITVIMNREETDAVRKCGFCHVITNFKHLFMVKVFTLFGRERQNFMHGVPLINFAVFITERLSGVANDGFRRQSRIVVNVGHSVTTLLTLVRSSHIIQGIEKAAGALFCQNL